MLTVLVILSCMFSLNVIEWLGKAIVWIVVITVKLMYFLGIVLPISAIMFLIWVIWCICSKNHPRLKVSPCYILYLDFE